MNDPAIAWLRALPDSYAGYYAAHGVVVDMARARRQHAAYADALRAAWTRIATVPADERFPDCVFIEDTAVVWERRVLRTRMTAHREGEQAAIMEEFAGSFDMLTLPAGATLDGGDVLHSDAITYVGRSTRTNAAGIAALRSFLGSARTVIEIPVQHCLHLKSAATWLGSGTMLAAKELIDTRRFKCDHIRYTGPGEAKAANTVRVRDHLLILDGYPATASALRQFADLHGLTLHRLGMSEFEKGDGSLTCLSILA